MRTLAGKIRPLLLAQRSIIGQIGEGMEVQVRPLDLTHGRYNRRGIDPSGEGRAHRYITAQMQTYVVQEQVTELRGSLREGKPGPLIGIQTPIPPRLDRSRRIQGDLEKMCRGKFPDISSTGTYRHDPSDHTADSNRPLPGSEFVPPAPSRAGPWPRKQKQTCYPSDT